jgi:hypothetical protein
MSSSGPLVSILRPQPGTHTPYNPAPLPTGFQPLYPQENSCLHFESRHLPADTLTFARAHVPGRGGAVEQSCEWHTLFFSDNMANFEGNPQHTFDDFPHTPSQHSHYSSTYMPPEEHPPSAPSHHSSSSSSHHYPPPGPPGGPPLGPPNGPPGGPPPGPPFGYPGPPFPGPPFGFPGPPGPPRPPPPPGPAGFPS